MKRSAVLLFCGIIVLAAILYSCKKEEPDPPTVTTAPVTKITATSALSGGDITNDGGAAITARGVCWSTSPSPMISDAHTSDSIGTGSYASTITGLQPETTYYMRGYATNSAGTAYDQDISFKTLEQSGKFIDIRDNREYKWVRIGEQVWMAENLAYLPSVSPSSDGSSTNPYYYVYDYQGSSVSEAKAADNYSTYGVSYNWPAALNACPAGWHLPTDEEWTELENYLVANGFNYDGTTTGNKIAKSLATSSGWALSSNTGAVGNTDYPDKRNLTGFTAPPGGNRFNDGSFSFIGSIGDWWIAKEGNYDRAWGWGMFSGNSGVGRSNGSKNNGLSVRCLRD